MEAPPGARIVEVRTIAPGTYFPDWPAIDAAGAREYDEARSFEASPVLPPRGPAAQVPMRTMNRSEGSFAP